MDNKRSRNAARLIGMMFKAETIVLAAGLLDGIVAGLSYASSVQNSDIAGPTAILLIISGIITLIAAILQLSATIKARRLNRFFMYSFISLIMLFVLVLIGQIAAGSGNSKILTTAAETLANIGELIVSTFGIWGILDLAKEVGNTELAAAAEKKVKEFIPHAALAVFADIITDIVSRTGIVGIVAGIALIVFLIDSYILYMKILYKAAREL